MSVTGIKKMFYGGREGYSNPLERDKTISFKGIAYLQRLSRYFFASFAFFFSALRFFT
jgi:hypothetical protein